MKKKIFFMVMFCVLVLAAAISAEDLTNIRYFYISFAPGANVTNISSSGELDYLGNKIWRLCLTPLNTKDYSYNMYWNLNGQEYHVVVTRKDNNTADCVVYNKGGNISFLELKKLNLYGFNFSNFNPNPNLKKAYIKFKPDAKPVLESTKGSADVVEPLGNNIFRVNLQPANQSILDYNMWWALDGKWWHAVMNHVSKCDVTCIVYNQSGDMDLCKNIPTKDLYGFTFSPTMDSSR